MKTWEQYHADVLKLLSTINEAGYRPDIICPCALGGVFPGMILAKHLGIKPGDYRVIDIEREGDERRLVYDVHGDIHGNRVLLVEDDLPTGKGPLYVKQLFEQRGAKVKIAAVYVNSTTQRITDFFAEIYNEDDPIEYPWKPFHAGDRTRE